MADTEGGSKILLVDDEEDVRIIAGQMLKAMGYKVETASDGYEGLEQFKTDPMAFSVILLDYSMPGMDGIETMKELRKLRGDVPILFSTGYSDDQTMQEMEAMNVNGVVRKPFMISELVDAITKVIG
jgi:two-component system cell cycle sensor histidine kinase/response regulator CckA